jgi:FkbM family methyltransferase
MSVFRVLWWPLRARARCAAAARPAAGGHDGFGPAVTVGDGATAVKYCTPNGIARWRAETLFTKEPDTIEWIRGFAPHDVFVDIGANVGMYSIWAAASRGVRVYAFEPESQNFALLNRNIVANGLSERVTAFCLALSDESGFSLLHLGAFATGGSGHTLGAELDHHLRPRPSAHAQGCVASTLDELVARGVLPVPTHVKIDVDGLEHKVIGGCRATLKDARLKSVLIEINSGLAEHRNIVEELLALGFRYSEEQVLAARRSEGAFAGVGNYVFQR